MESNTASSAVSPPPFDFAHAEYPLAPLTLYKVGGAARWALVPRTVEEAAEAYAWMTEQPGPKTVLGGGSNVLIADAGFPGVVFITTELRGLQSLGEGRYYAESGVELGQVVREVMLPNNYDVVGGLTGIPGSIGGAWFMNAGTVKGTICQVTESVDVIAPGAPLHTVPMDPSLYGYRGQTYCPRGGLILSGILKFTVAEEPQQPIYDRYIQRRKETQPQGNCCGSVFKNPEGNHAGRLIESCGLKGTRHGGAVISEKHANFFLNEQDASAGDILWLIEHARQTVRERHGIELETEVVYIG
jgi:UDP-N-acetylmuramate dehydrogenase